MTISAAPTTTGELNDVGYNNPAYDAFMNKASVAIDGKERARLLGQAERQLIDDGAVVPLNFPAYRALVSPQIKGWQENILNLHPSRFLSE